MVNKTKSDEGKLQSTKHNIKTKVLATQFPSDRDDCGCSGSSRRCWPFQPLLWVTMIFLCRQNACLTYLERQVRIDK